MPTLGTATVIKVLLFVTCAILRFFLQIFHDLFPCLSSGRKKSLKISEEDDLSTFLRSIYLIFGVKKKHTNAPYSENNWAREQRYICIVHRPHQDAHEFFLRARKLNFTIYQFQMVRKRITSRKWKWKGKEIYMQKTFSNSCLKSDILFCDLASASILFEISCLYLFRLLVFRVDRFYQVLLLSAVTIYENNSPLKVYLFSSISHNTPLFQWH